jgi:nucleotide-binding universal stress UspA family protein
MALKDLMLVADNSDETEATFDYAAALAGDHDAHLIVLYPIPVLPPAMYMGIEYSTDWLATVSDNIRREAAICRERLEARAKTIGISIEWRSDEGEPSRVAAEFSRYVDLTLMTQNGSGHDREDMRTLSEYFILESGRPVIQVPYIGAPAKPPRHIIVGWDGSRTATRALHDALPLLSTAEQVELLSIRGDNHPDDAGEIAAIDISAHLARHGVNVETRVLVAEHIEPADLLLSHLSDCGAEMVVMGAYGHSRLRELVLGGMTRGILRSMTVPVLLSH